MNRLVSLSSSSALLLGVLFSLASCGDPAVRARKKLEDNNIPFSVDDFVHSAGRGDAESVRLFVDAGIDVGAQDIDGYTALIRAAEEGHVEVVQALIAAGANVDAQGVDGVSALMQAAYYDRLEVVRILLDAKADVRPVDEKDWTAFMKAVYRGNQRIVELMLPHSADEGGKALVLAAVMGNAKVLQTLLNGGVSPDAGVDRGQTALMIAASRNNEEIVRILLSRGAQALAADTNGQTASMIAASKGHRSLARLLIEAEQGKTVAMLDPSTASASTPTPAAPTASPTPTPEAPPPSELPQDSATDKAVKMAVSDPVAPTQERESSSPTPTPPVETALISIPTPTPLPETELSPRPAQESIPVPIAPIKQPEVIAAESSPSFEDLVEEAPLSPSSVDPSALPKMRLIDFQESQIPVLLSGVNAGIGEFVLMASGDRTYAREGDVIPGTNFTVVSLRSRRIIDKDGSPVDASEARVRERGGREHRLVKDLPARASRSAAVLAIEGHSQNITVRTGEEFFLQSDPVNMYRVVDLRSDGAVLQLVETGETFTVRP